jgi:hypothetical protein
VAGVCDGYVAGIWRVWRVCGEYAEMPSPEVEQAPVASVQSALPVVPGPGGARHSRSRRETSSHQGHYICRGSRQGEVAEKKAHRSSSKQQEGHLHLPSAGGGLACGAKHKKARKHGPTGLQASYTPACSSELGGATCCREAFGASSSGIRTSNPGLCG